MIKIINDFPPNTGSGNYAFSLFNELKKETQIKMHYINYENDSRKPEEGLIEEKPLGLPVMKRTFNNLFILPKKISDEDIIHCTNQFLANYAKFNKKTVVTCLDVIPLQTPHNYPRFMSFFLKKSLEAMKKSEKIITISEYSKNKLIEIGKIEPEKITPIHLGINSKIFYPKTKFNSRKKLNIPKNKKIILNVGSEEERKNIETLIEAFKEIKKEISEATLVRVGEKTKKIEKHAKKNNVKIKYFSKVNEETLSNIYSIADVFVYPSVLEGFGFPPLEAMACKIPVVSSTLTSLKEILPKNKSNLKNPLDPQEIAEKTIKVLTDNNYSNKLAEQGLIHSKKFTWKKTAEKTKQVYNQI
jgi:glycosyltransferase involved in cell wall biosynthesis